MFARIVLAQLRHKWEINLLLFLTVTALVSLHVFIVNANRYTVRSMQLIMKGMGLNQLMVPEEQPVSETYLCTARQRDFPETVTETLAAHAELLSRYYVSMLQRRAEVDGRLVVLTGIRPVARRDETAEKGNPVRPVAPGTVRLGSGAGEALGAARGGRVALMGRTFEVAQIMPEQGTLDDCRVFLELADMQALVGTPGVINVVLSFECLHVGGSLEKIHAYQRRALARVMPGFRQINIASIARGRYFARRMTAKYQY